MLCNIVNIFFTQLFIFIFNNNQQECEHFAWYVPIVSIMMISRAASGSSETLFLTNSFVNVPTASKQVNQDL